MSELAQLPEQSEEGDAPYASQLPSPRGYKILIALPDPDREYDGGILKTTKAVQDEEVGSIVGMVLEIARVVLHKVFNPNYGNYAAKIAKTAE